MNNEIQRKITSLTLMTIMLAGGMVIAAPGIMPAAHAANANLFVSAEKAEFDNYMSGPQVIEKVKPKLQLTVQNLEWFKQLMVTGMVTLQIEHKQ